MKPFFLFECKLTVENEGSGISFYGNGHQDMSLFVVGCFPFQEASQKVTLQFCFLVCVLNFGSKSVMGLYFCVYKAQLLTWGNFEK